MQDRFRTLGSIFQNLDEKAFNDASASLGARHDHLRPGHYLARIDCVKDGQMQSTEDFIAIEKTITKVYDNYGGLGHSVGDQVDLFMPARKVKKVGMAYFYRDVKNAFGAIIGVDPEKVEMSQCAQFFTEDQPLVGLCIEIKAVEKPDDGYREIEPGKKKVIFLRPKPIRRRLLAAEILEEHDEQTLARFWTPELLEYIASVEEALAD